MQQRRKWLRIVVIALLILQIPWFLVVQHIVSTTQIKTIATVIRIDRTGSYCSSTALCDTSSTLYPVYEFKDQRGVSHQKDDRYFGQYKQNNPLGKLFLKRVGDKVTTYYPADKPSQALFMSSPLAYTAWLIPMYVVIALLIGSAALLIIGWLWNRSHS